MIEIVTTLALMVSVLAGRVGVSTLTAPTTTRRPPRHQRPKGWTGPPERAPFPPVAEWPPETEVLRMLQHPGTSALSPLNREVMWRRFRVMWGQAQAGRADS